MARPILGDVELQQVQEIEVEGDQVLVQHGVPALEGDFLQRLGRRGTRVTLTGVLTGPQAGGGLKSLRDKFRAAEPLPFVADITTATRVDQVLIEEMGVRELAGKPERFEYAFTLREYTPLPPPEEEPPPEIETPENPAERIDQRVGALRVEVTVEGQAGFDFSTVTVTVEGEEEDGTTLSRTLTNRTDNVWTEGELPAGQYTVEAVATASAAVTGSVLADVRPGETTQVKIALRPGPIIAKTFVIHFRFDKSFIEPCMRPVMKQVAKYANDHDQKLVIVGHTDKTGPETYNQSLSERRARSAYAYLTFGRDRDAALAEWNALRQARPKGELVGIKDSWGTHEYQFMLQDLGFYPGPVDGDHGPLTNDAVRAYRCKKGLPPGTTVDDDVWKKLIEDYLAEASPAEAPLAVPADRFLPNAREGCDGGILEWLGCGEESPLPPPTSTKKTPTKKTAWRPYRRVEFLFVTAEALPRECKVPRPATLDLPPPEEPNTWCLGPGTPERPCCFATRKCDEAEAWQWCITPAEPGTITVQGSIKREVRLPGGSTRPEPVPRQEFALIAPNGAYKADETARGEPQPARTDSNGNFGFPDLPVGVYSLEVVARRRQDFVLVRLHEAGYETVKGNAVCKCLTPSDSRLDVVIVDASVLREIRLPVVAHLMTALHPLTRAVRTCPDPVDPTKRVQQATARTEGQVQMFFAGVNRIWRQARIRFDPIYIVHEAYAYRTDCEVDETEFVILLKRCAYPNAVNVFFLGDLAGTGEAGFGISVENGAAEGVAGCAVGDRFQFTVFTPPLNVTLDEKQAVQVLAHELGHFLNLEHVNDTSANADRLMLPRATLAGDNRTLTSDEVNQARASRGAADDCVPLSLHVTGATQVGGRLSHQFIVLQNPSGVVTVDAQIPGRLVGPGVGTLTMTGGNSGANDRQRTVSTATTGETEVIATYIPAGDGIAVTTRAVIRVVTFRLRVEGATQVGGRGSTTFVSVRDPAAVVTVVADIDPAPFCVPTTLVTWTNGDPTPGPLRRTVSRATTAHTTVSATLAGTTHSVDIWVVWVTLGNFRNSGNALSADNNPPLGLAAFGAANLGLSNTATRIGNAMELRGDVLPAGIEAVPGVAFNFVRMAAMRRWKEKTTTIHVLTQPSQHGAVINVVDNGDGSSTVTTNVNLALLPVVWDQLPADGRPSLTSYVDGRLIQGSDNFTVISNMVGPNSKVTVRNLGATTPTIGDFIILGDLTQVPADDDVNDLTESLTPINGHIYDWDAPGVQNRSDPDDVRLRMKWNFIVYVELLLNDALPHTGVKCSNEFAWHAIFDLTKSGPGWIRTPDEKNEVSPGHIIIGENP
jgi:outer membrane protein OmpA-like peptidoglycan-associated protein